MVRFLTLILALGLAAGCSEDTATAGSSGTGGPDWQIGEGDYSGGSSLAECPAEVADTCETNALCSPGQLECVECLGDNDCSRGEPFCDVLDGECRECFDDDDCGVAEPICDLEDFECVAACETAGDCENDELPMCDNETGRCLECFSNEDCDGEICTDFGLCVECLASDDCPAGEPLCRPDGECVECSGDADCGGGEPYCVDWECSACATDAQCDSGEVCDHDERECAPCVEETHRGCSGELPFCDDGEACVECTEDEQCAGGEECDNNECVAAN